MPRRLPRPGDLRPLLQPRRPQLSPAAGRVARAASVADLRAAARRRAPRAVFDYTDGAAGDEIALRRAREAFGRVEFRPRVLRDVARPDPSATLLGRRAPWPIAFAPTGFTRMMHAAGEPAVARVAERAGIPYALSTLGTTSIEDLAHAVPAARKWFQLYLTRDPAANDGLVQRAADAGYEALMLTVDAPVGGNRLRDVRNGLTIPPALTLRTFANAAVHPGWWFDLLTTEPLEFASFRQWDATVSELMTNVFDPTATLETVRRLRRLWSGPLVVKGVQAAADAAAVAGEGVDAVVISNHGGRQLDRAPVPLELLPEVRAAVGDGCEVWIDGGIMSGGDVVAAVARGATGCLVGRAYLYGLMAGGERGVQRALDLLTAEITLTLQLLGVPRLADLTAECVRMR